jgi:hypothetical protein
MPTEKLKVTFYADDDVAESLVSIKPGETSRRINELLRQALIVKPTSRSWRQTWGPTAKPTAFDELRYGYFDTAFGNILKAIRGGANPIAVTTLAMCSVGAWSEIDWAISNSQHLEATGELKANAQKPRDRRLFEAWLNRWVRDTGINSNCDATRTYGLRCALVHTGAASEALSKTGVKAWYITANDPSNHCAVKQADVLRFYFEMPEFLAELMLAADRSLNDQKIALEQASPELRSRIGFIAGPSSADLSTRLINNIGSLAWFDERLSVTPLTIAKQDLANQIRNAYYEAVNNGLVFEYQA